ncbi:MAG: hypothetical protein A2V67_01075 [Deltaproteobacteria bacterium RBG_13_61_14]|nr:MAG: hypothetical protein A2V67_01075 [Deltaproteobacteria bacterium RBG_13_61_14]
MKPEAGSEMIYNVLKHKFNRAANEDLLEAAKKLQVPQGIPPRRASQGLPPSVSKQKLSRQVLRDMRGEVPRV